LFSESTSRFVVEVRPEYFGELAGLWAGLPFGRIGEVTAGAGSRAAAGPRLIVMGLNGSMAIDAATADLKTAWRRPLSWS
jgi:phosphoribosylformylglycinamidine synthase